MFMVANPDFQLQFSGIALVQKKKKCLLNIQRITFPPGN